MKKNLVSAAVFAVIFAVTAACGGGNDHTHDFSGNWHSDETEHWKECPNDNAKGQTAPTHGEAMSKQQPPPPPQQGKKPENVPIAAKQTHAPLRS